MYSRGDLPLADKPARLALGGLNLALANHGGPSIGKRHHLGNRHWISDWGYLTGSP